MICTNAEIIVAARMKGKKPVDMVIVSMVGQVGVENPTVFAKVDTPYDWRWVRDLDVCVYLHDDHDWPDILKAIALNRPSHLSLWNVSGHWGATVHLIPSESDIAKPPRYWKFELDFMPWMDFQNEDFMLGRSYARNQYGVPHAIN